MGQRRPMVVPCAQVFPASGMIRSVRAILRIPSSDSPACGDDPSPPSLAFLKVACSPSCEDAQCNANVTGAEPAALAMFGQLRCVALTAVAESILQ
jgi:hypothetical protein